MVDKILFRFHHIIPIQFFRFLFFYFRDIENKNRIYKLCLQPF